VLTQHVFEEPFGMTIGRWQAKTLPDHHCQLGR
jgi:hypothetical protein